MSNLQRFHDAHNKLKDGYADALKQIENGRKTSHWIWYIFPQIKGMGNSPNARKYAIEDWQEACDYLKDDTLADHYQAMLQAVHVQLRDKGNPVVFLMGKEIDAMKLRSSVTLFEQVAMFLADQSPETEKYKNLANYCTKVADRLKDQGYPRCQTTLQKVNFLVASKEKQSHAPTEVHDNHPQISSDFEIALCQQLKTYIHQRASEPTHWYQGIFSGYSKKDKLRAALTLYQQVAGSENTHKEFNQLASNNSVHLDDLKSENLKTLEPVLRQGRLGKTLRAISKSDQYQKDLPAQNPKQYPSNTVRNLLACLQNSSSAQSSESISNISEP